MRKRTFHCTCQASYQKHAFIIFVTLKGTYGVKGDTETRPKDTGSLFSLDTDGTVKTHKTGIVLSNGMTWSNDNRTMFYTDSLVKTVWAYDFDLESGTISLYFI